MNRFSIKRRDIRHRHAGRRPGPRRDRRTRGRDPWHNASVPAASNLRVGRRITFNGADVIVWADGGVEVVNSSE